MYFSGEKAKNRDGESEKDIIKTFINFTVK